MMRPQQRAIFRDCAWRSLAAYEAARSSAAWSRAATRRGLDKNTNEKDKGTIAANSAAPAISAADGDAQMSCAVAEKHASRSGPIEIDPDRAAGSSHAFAAGRAASDVRSAAEVPVPIPARAENRFTPRMVAMHLAPLMPGQNPCL